MKWKSVSVLGCGHLWDHRRFAYSYPMSDLQYDDRQAYSSVRILFSRVRLDRHFTV